MTRPTALRAALLLTVIVAAAYAYETGLFESLQAERLESTFREFGAWGPVLYVALFALLEAFFVPGIVFVAGGGLVWDWPLLFVLSLLGATGAAIVGYVPSAMTSCRSGSPGGRTPMTPPSHATAFAPSSHCA